MSRRFTKRRRRGAALIEFAVTLPLLVLILFATIEACSMVYLQQSLKIAAYVLLAAGLLMIVAFSKNDTKNPFKRIFGSLGTLYGITGYASDILSYSRILALMLSSAVVGMVMNMLAGMVLKTGVWWQTLLTFPFALLIYLAGHVFNLVMSLLSAYVHASRLQYIEFYGKFYEGGGYPFRPLALGTKYYKVETDTH